jgi:hypothetical protein
VDQVFGVKSNSNHPLKDARDDILLMAQSLHSSSIARVNGRGVLYKAINPQALGAVKLGGETLAKFNASECLDDDEALRESLLGQEDLGVDEPREFFRQEEIYDED